MAGKYSFGKSILLLTIIVAIVAILFSNRESLSLLFSTYPATYPALRYISSYIAQYQPTRRSPTDVMPSKAPVYFFSHGGPDVQYNTRHPAYSVLQNIGKEITQKVKPKAVVVFSGHWEGEPNTILVNKAEHTELIYDFYGFPPEFYKAQYPHRGDPELAFRIMSLLGAAGIKSQGVTRGLDHGVWSGFHVAFHPEHNPLNVPIVQVSLYLSEDPDKHYRLGQAVSALRDEGVVIIGAGMSVHNLRDYMLTRGRPTPLPYSVSFDEALKEAVETAAPEERQVRMAEVARRPDARQAHPRMDHLMPVYVAAGAAGSDVGKRTWTLHEGSMAWAQYRFGELPREEDAPASSAL